MNNEKEFCFPDIKIFYFLAIVIIFGIVFVALEIDSNKIDRYQEKHIEIIRITTL